jgi:membrane-associated phospholipid phosphatase
MHMLELLNTIDQELFLAIHLGGQHALLDWLAPLLRNKFFWVPLYVFLLSYIWYNARPWFWRMVLAIVVVVTVTDTISSRVVKPLVQRERPCREAYMGLLVRPLVACGPGKSFTSSHATNHFGIAVFFIMTLGFIQKHHRWLWLIWAALVSLSQVYVGVHYPGDILGGAILGGGLGWVLGLLFRRYLYPPIETPYDLD